MKSARARKEAVPPRPDYSATSDIDALDLAMVKKRKSYDIYIDLARSTKNPNIKVVFEKIAKEECLDYELLEQTMSSIASQSIWEENGPIEGG
ncbi:MAG: hypothetical protein WA666_12260 [Nitrospirota bacterium]